MDRTEQFRQALQAEMVMTLSTAAEGRVTMRAVSPVPVPDGVLFFTGRDSQKYRQLQANPRCCIAVGPFYAECTAAFCGPTMAEQNAALRAAYAEKFPGAFDEGVSFGGREAEFLLLHPVRLSGWAFENDVPTPDGVPTIPFELTLS